MTIENLEKGGPISIADRFITNNGSAEELIKAVEDYMKEIWADGKLLK